ncbi:MAG: MoaD family protein [archaeon]|nr:MoaD family protein [archaeon]MCP8316759.1 MoaD family protein [archaeon]
MVEEISITLKYFATIRDITGKKEESLSLKKGYSIMDLLMKLAEVYGEKISQFIFGEKKEIKENLTFLINGKAIKNENLSRKLKDGDVFVILPPISGG